MAADPDIPEPDRRGDLPHPRDSFQLIGQAQAEQAFLAALNHGRLHHAWLIQGPEGIGKATLAYRIARYVLAHGNRPTSNLDVPADHPVSRQISSQGHPDLLVLRRPYDLKDKKLRTVITVDEVRRAGQFFSKTAGAAGWRVAIVDCADDMNPGAANALLKTLEEPPPQGLFLVITHAPGGLLPTIRSRCRPLQLKPLSPGDISVLVQRLVQDIKLEDLDLLIDLADGSAGRAMSLGAEKALDLYRDMNAMLSQLPKLDLAALHSFAGRFDRAGEEGGQQFKLIGDLLAQWLLRKVRSLAADGAGGLDRWVELWDKSARLLERADSVNLQRKQVLLDLFLAMQTAAR
jgi:DNA polymerase-3 subunit delta'